MVTLMSKVTFLDLEILRPAISLRMWCFLNSCKEGDWGTSSWSATFSRSLTASFTAGYLHISCSVSKNDSRHKKKMARFWKRKYQKDSFDLLDECTTCRPYISRFGFQSCFSVPASSVLSLAGPVRLALHTGLCWGEKIMAEDFRKNIFLHMYASFGQNQQLKMVWA